MVSAEAEADVNVGAGDAAATKTSPLGTATAGDALEELAASTSSLPAAGASGQRRRKRRPGEAWDGRFAGLSLREFREVKWGSQAGFAQVERRGPAYTIRQSCKTRSRSATDVLLPVDVVRSFNSVQRSGPSWTVGRSDLPLEKERSHGPGHYTFKSTMDPNPHPLYSRDLGRKFGTERLLVNDEAMPAPGDYSVAGFEKSGRYKKSPNYVIQGREAWREPTAAPGPGVGDYKFENVFRTGKTTPVRWSLQGKTEITDPPTGFAEQRLWKRVEQTKRKMKFEVELQYDKVSTILLLMEGPDLVDVFRLLQENAAYVRDPNAFLISSAMKRLGNGAGAGSRRFVSPAPTEYNPPGAGGDLHATKEEAPGWHFSREVRGLV